MFSLRNGRRQAVRAGHEQVSWANEERCYSAPTLSSDRTVRDATRYEIEQLKRENGELKEIVADLLLETHRLKKTAIPPLKHGPANPT